MEHSRDIPLRNVYGLYQARTRVGLVLPSGHNALMAVGVASWVIKEALAREWVRPGDWVLDPFAGYGTGLVIALENNLNVIGVEVEPHHYEVLVHELRSAHDEKEWIAISGDSRELRSLLEDDNWLAGRNIALTFTSPPYGKTLRPGDEGPYASSISANERASVRKARQDAKYGAYGTAPGQLAISHDFWPDLATVFGQVYDVTSAGGRMITVTKDYVLNDERVDVCGKTIAAAESAGFVPQERIIAHGAYGGLWKRIANNRYVASNRRDLVVDHEDFLVFRKE